LSISVLAKILDHKKREIAELKKRLSLSEIRNRAEKTSPAKDLISALSSGKELRIIAEIKRASPSKGIIARNCEPAVTGRQYQRGGAAAISVLTDERFFRGSLSHLAAVKEAVSLPVLRKDFLIDPCQIYESRAAGADAVLLIVAAMQSAGHLSDLLCLSRSLGMEPLVEVHTESEAETALNAQSVVIGINNRDLDSFEVNLSVSKRLATVLGKDKVKVSESGITSLNDMLCLLEYGVDAFLIGERFMSSSNPGKSLSGMIDEWGKLKK